MTVEAELPDWQPDFALETRTRDGTHAERRGMGATDCSRNDRYGVLLPHKSEPASLTMSAVGQRAENICSC